MTSNINKKVALVAPAGKPRNPDYIRPFKKLLQIHGFEVIYTQGFVSDANDHLPFYANTLEKRTADLIKYLQDENIKYIWGLRGGFGANEVVQNIYERKINLKGPKVFIGFSDLTCIHNFMNKFYGQISIHGPVVTQATTHQDDIVLVLDLLNGNQASYKIQLTSINTNNIKLIDTQINGTILGGNLTVLASMIGTPNHPNINDKILLIEDVNEPSYKIKRCLEQLRQAGVINKFVKAIICGNFSSLDPYIDAALEDFRQCLEEQGIDIPFFKTDEIGHGKKNSPIIFGHEVSIKIDSKGKSYLNISNPFLKNTTVIECANN